MLCSRNECVVCYTAGKKSKWKTKKGHQKTNNDGWSSLHTRMADCDCAKAASAKEHSEAHQNTVASKVNSLICANFKLKLLLTASRLAHGTRRVGECPVLAARPDAPPSAATAAGECACPKKAP